MPAELCPKSARVSEERPDALPHVWLNPTGGWAYAAHGAGRTACGPWGGKPLKQYQRCERESRRC